MLALLSPAKRLDFAPSTKRLAESTPALLTDAEQLVLRVRRLKSKELMDLMGISQKLADLNVERFRHFEMAGAAPDAKQAIFAFRGDTYQGFDADSLDAKGLRFAQAHVRILSGLYGLLRPLDLIQPYRLGMGTELSTAQGRNLYSFWREKVTDAINDAAPPKRGAIIVNLASNEYFNAVDPKRLHRPIVTCVFKEAKNGKAKVVSFCAKRARGSMARFICDQRITKIDALKDFDRDGYRYVDGPSTDDCLEFHRKALSA